MRLKPHLLSALLTCIALPCSSPSAAGQAYLSGEEITTLLAGQRVEGEEDGTKWEELFAPGGDIEGNWGGDAYRGDWKVVDDRLCLDYTGTTDDGCWHLGRGRGGVIFWYMHDGTLDMRRQGIRLKE